MKISENWYTVEFHDDLGEDEVTLIKEEEFGPMSDSEAYDELYNEAIEVIQRGETSGEIIIDRIYCSRTYSSGVDSYSEEEEQLWRDCGVWDEYSDRGLKLSDFA